MKFPLVPGLYRVLALVLFIIGRDLPVIHHPTYQFYMSSLINRLAQLSEDVLLSAVQVKRNFYFLLFSFINLKNRCRLFYQVLRGW